MAPQLACDVNMTEQWELGRLENGRTPSPRSPGERLWGASDAIDSLMEWGASAALRGAPGGVPAGDAITRMRMPQAMAVLHEARKSSVPLEKNLVLVQVAMETEQSSRSMEPPVVAEPIDVLPMPRRGRVRANGTLTAANSGNATAPTEFSRLRRTLMEKGEYRRMRSVHEVAPAGTSDLNAAPDFLRDFGGGAGDADAFEEAMLNWTDSNLNEGK